MLEFIPQERLAWDAKALGVDAYHAWTLQPGTDGCRVLTEETQHGLVATVSHRLMPGRMHKYHQIWLEALERQARGPNGPDAAGGGTADHPAQAHSHAATATATGR